MPFCHDAIEFEEENWRVSRELMDLAIENLGEIHVRFRDRVLTWVELGQASGLSNRTGHKTRLVEIASVVV